MFRYADGVDKLLMFFGTLGSLGDGLQTPLMMYILSDVINAYGDKNSHLTRHGVNKVSLFNKIFDPLLETTGAICVAQIHHLV